VLVRRWLCTARLIPLVLGLAHPRSRRSLHVVVSEGDQIDADTVRSKTQRSTVLRSGGATMHALAGIRPSRMRIRGSFMWSYIPSSAAEGTWAGFWFPKSPFTKSAMLSRLWARLMEKNGSMKGPRCGKRRGWRRTWKARIGALTSKGSSVNGIRDRGSTTISALR
jgi:hypothetical protein